MPKIPSLVLEAESPAPAPGLSPWRQGPHGLPGLSSGPLPCCLPRAPVVSPGVAAAPTSQPQSCGPS